MTTFETLQQRYAAEHEKRVRLLKESATNKVATLRHEDSSMDKDFFASKNVGQERILGHDEQVKVLIVGAGMHGLMAASRLITHAGLATEDIALVDRAGGWGGTWYWNRYPGVMCDIEGYCYLPLLEETGYVPSQK